MLSFVGAGLTKREGEEMKRNQNIRVSQVELAECPEDGGKWAIYCEHYDADSGDWLTMGILQDTNKARLAKSRLVTFSDGLTEFCPECYEMTADNRDWSAR